MKSKTILLLIFTFPLWGLGVLSCSKNDAVTDPKAQLPPETQVGANTFGVTINDKVYVPRDPAGTLTGPSSRGMYFWGAPDNISWVEIEVQDGKSNVGFQMIVHIQNFDSVGVGMYILKKSNYQKGIDSVPFSNIYFKVWDSNIGNYTYYGSVKNQGFINITRVSNGIVSGNFQGNFVRYDNPNEFIKVTDGRFDINTSTLSTTKFP